MTNSHSDISRTTPSSEGSLNRRSHYQELIGIQTDIYCSLTRTDADPEISKVKRSEHPKSTYYNFCLWAQRGLIEQLYFCNLLTDQEDSRLMGQESQKHTTPGFRGPTWVEGLPFMWGFTFSW